MTDSSLNTLFELTNQIPQPQRKGPGADSERMHIVFTATPVARIKQPSPGNQPATDPRNYRPPVTASVPKSQNDSASKKKRLPRNHRAAREELPGFRLTERDDTIIATVSGYRMLTTNQVEALVFSSGQRQDRNTLRSICRSRLQLLYHYGYLVRDEQPQKLSEGRKPFLYFLDTKGAQRLCERTGTLVSWSRRDNEVSWLFREHLLATNDVRVAIATAAKRYGWTIPTWVDDKSLKRDQMQDIVVLKDSEGSEHQAAVVPDGYFVLDLDAHLYHFFLEVDLRTVTVEARDEGARTWQRKVKAYLEYYESGAYEKRYETGDMRVLTITTGEKRLRHLKAATERAGGRGRFWFTTFEAITTGDILVDPIWAVATRANRRPLMSTETSQDPV